MTGTSPRPPYQKLFIYYLKGHLPVHLQLGPDFIGNWQEEADAFLFFSAPGRIYVDALLTDWPDLVYVDEYQMNYEQWQGERFEGLRIGRFYIAPPWADRQKEPVTQDLEITLDPGVVFGAGTHGTTADCLRALQIAWQIAPYNTAMDLGIGSGLLAIAATRLGCSRTVAVDINRLAVETAHANIVLNGCGDQVLAVQGDALSFGAGRAEMLIANIHYDVMTRLIGAQRFSGQKWLVLSGLLRSEAGDIENRLRCRDIRIIKKWAHEGVWHTFLAQPAHARPDATGGSDVH